MARLQDFQTVTPTSADKLLVVQSQGQGLVPYGSKLDSANPSGTGALSLNRKSGTTTGSYSVTEGRNCEASGDYSHAEGYQTKASNTACHAEGTTTQATGLYSHAEGNQAIASGQGSHADGSYTIANHRSQHVFGELNAEDTSTAAATARGNFVEIVGNGTGTNARSNARTLDWSGNEVLAGDLTFNGNVSLNSLMNNSFTPTDLTLQNGAENYSFTSYYYKKFGRVTINMSLKSLSTASTVVATLPSGYKPRTTTSFVISDGTATGTCGLNIASSGAMTVWKSSTQYAIGEISFDAFN